MYIIIIESDEEEHCIPFKLYFLLLMRQDRMAFEQV